MIVIINPTQMGPQELALVKQFIENNKEKHTNDFFSKEHSYEVHFPGGIESQHIQFTHDLFRRKSAKGGPDRYEVEPDKEDPLFVVGAGFYGEVRQLLGTISPDKETGAIRFKSREEKMKSRDAFGRPKHRVVKEIDVTPSAAQQFTLDEVKSEVAAAKVVSYLGAKDEAICHHKGVTTARVVSRMLEGRGFVGALEDIQRGKIHLTVDQRVALSLSLLQTLKNEIHDKGYIHRDIKPENIIFQATKNYDVMNTYIIDFGFAMPTGKQDSKICGTPNYVAPEVCYGRPATSYPQSDLFGMSKLIGYIWRAFPPLYNPADRNGSVAAQIDYRFDRLFSGISDLSEDHKNKIRVALEAAHLEDPLVRSSVSDMIGVFQEIQKSLRESRMSPSVSMSLTPQSSVSPVSDASVDDVVIDISSDTSPNPSPDITLFRKRPRSGTDEIIPVPAVKRSLMC